MQMFYSQFEKEGNFEKLNTPRLILSLNFVLQDRSPNRQACGLWLEHTVDGAQIFQVDWSWRRTCIYERHNSCPPLNARKKIQNKWSTGADEATCNTWHILCALHVSCLSIFLMCFTFYVLQSSFQLSINHIFTIILYFITRDFARRDCINWRHSCWPMATYVAHMIKRRSRNVKRRRRCTCAQYVATMSRSWKTIRVDISFAKVRLSML